MMSEQEKKEILDYLWEDVDGDDKKQIELCLLDIAMKNAHRKAAELARKQARIQMEELLYLMLTSLSSRHFFSPCPYIICI